MKKEFVALVYLIFPFLLIGQDSYYTNSYSAALYNNPSNVSLLNSDQEIRFNTLNRTHWVNSHVVYSSHYIEANRIITNQDVIDDNLNFDVGIGAYLNQNIQGEGKLKTTQGNFVFGASGILEKKNNLVLYGSAGLSLGTYIRSVDFSEFELNDQIITSAPVSRDLIGLSTGRNSKFDISFGGTFGIQFIKTKTKEHLLLLGVSGSHLLDNKSISFFSDFEETLHRRFSVNLIYDKINKQSSVSIKNIRRIYGTYNLQGAYNQADIGLLYQFTFGNINWSKSKNRYNRFFEFGAGARGINKSLGEFEVNSFFGFVRTGFNLKDIGWSFGFSQDFPFPDKLGVTSGHSSAQEIYITKKFNTGVKNKDNLPCPDF